MLFGFADLCDFGDILVDELDDFEDEDAVELDFLELVEADEGVDEVLDELRPGDGGELVLLLGG